MLKNKLNIFLMNLLMTFFQIIYQTIKILSWLFWIITYNFGKIIKIPVIFGLSMFLFYFLLWFFSGNIIIYFIVIFSMVFLFVYISKRLYSEKSIIFPMILVFLFYLLIVFLVNIKKNIYGIIGEMLELMNINPNAEFSIILITNGTKLLIYIIPLILTFFYFSYREQKSLAISLYGFWNYKMLIFIVSSLFAIISGKHIGLLMNQNITNSNIPLFSMSFGKYLNILIKPITSNEYSIQEYSSQITLWFIFLIFTILFGLSVIKDQMNSFNINYQLIRNIDKMHNFLSFSYFSFSENQLKFYYAPLCRTVDSIYQLLFLTIEKNMVQDYDNNFTKWSDIVYRITDEPIRIEVKNTSKSPIILDIAKDNEEFNNFFKSILKNHITLISRNIQNNRIEEAKKALKLLKLLKLNPPELKEYYYGITLHELVFLAFKQDFINLLLDEFIDLINSESSQDSGLILSLYNRMIVYCIEKNDVNLISKIIYLMTINHLEALQEKVDITDYQLNIIPSPIIKATGENSEQLKAKIYNIYLAAIKCIELSQYSQTGFIIKFLVTNFNGHLLKEVYENLEYELLVKNTDRNPYYETYTNLSVNIDLNRNTMDYCFRKFSLLLYLQQKYVTKNRIILSENIKVSPYISIFKLISNTSYINYLYEKILKSKDKYNLLYLNDRNFLANIEKKILKNKKNTD